MKLLVASAPGNHRHKCCSCQAVWEHSNDEGGSWEAHTCPACGREPGFGPFDTAWGKYLGPDIPNCIKLGEYVAGESEPVHLDDNDPEVAEWVEMFNSMCKAKPY